jgi:8-oxo-dGTP diphosphatase
MEQSVERRTGWPRAAASAAIFRNGSVLVVERGKGAMTGIWSLPGGHIEPGETAQAAALREVGEETGIAAQIVGLAGVHDVIVRDEQGLLTAHYVLAVYYGRWLSGEPHAQSDSRDARFLPIHELGNLKLTPKAAELISRAWSLLGSEADTGLPRTRPESG